MKKALFFVLIIMMNKVVAQNDCFNNCAERMNAERALLTDPQITVYQSCLIAGSKIVSNLKGCPFPKTELSTLDSQKINIDKFKGSLVLVHFWIPSCAPCAAEVTAINQLIGEYKGKKVVFLAIANDAAQNVIAFLKEKEKFDAIQTYVDGQVIDQYFCTIAGFPMNLILDKEGKVIDVWSGGSDDVAKQSLFHDRVKVLLDANLN